MKAALEVINQMQADSVIGNYAIGGAVGATFYLEPVAALDIDVFVSFYRGRAGSPLPAASRDNVPKQGWETFRQRRT
jgi:hypothetical protein